MAKYTPTKEQQQVIDARHANCLVSAAAGSGKTSVLVDRIIGLITDPVNPIDIDELIVVTFTRAAAAEMKERIEKALDDLIEEKGDDPHIAKQSGLIEGALITTIDSFCMQFLREHFYLIPFEPNFRIMEEGEVKLLENDMLDRALNEFYEAEDPVFFELLEDYASERDDSKIADIIEKMYKCAISSPFPEKALDTWLSYYSEDKVKSVEDLPFYVDLKHEYDAVVGDAVKSMGEAFNIMASCPELQKGVDNYTEALESVEALQNVCSYKDCKDKLSTFSKITAPKISKLEGDALISKDKALALRNGAYKGIEDLKSYFKDDSDAIIKEHCAIRPYIEVLVNITKRYMDILAEEKIKRNAMSFSDLSHYTLSILYDENNEPTKVAKEFGARFKEIMIDEYQDSSYVQEYIMNAIVDKSCEKSDIFMVGDVKQSIYRFRQAVPKLFIDKYDNFSLDEKAKDRKILLNANFRSRSEVTDYANGLFESVMQEDLGRIIYDDDAKLVPKGSFVPSACDNKPEVIIVETNTDEDDKFMLEMAAIATRIKELLKTQLVTDSETKELRPARLSDIVILTRASTEDDAIIEALRRFDIPAVTMQGGGYFETLEVNTVLKFLSLIDNSSRDIEIATVLTSPIIGIDHASLAKIKAVEGKRFSDKVKNYLTEGDSEEIKDKLKVYFDYLTKLKQYASFNEVHELIRKIYEITDYEKYVMFMEGGELRRRNLLMLIEMAKNFEKTSYKGLSQFNRYIEKLKKYEVDTSKAQVLDAGNAVTLMTMHKSKGLEFPIVIVARIDKEFGGLRDKSEIYVDINKGIGMYKFDGKRRTKKTSYAYNAIKHINEIEGRAEELRVLYVALTRAKEKLIITGRCKNYPDQIGKWEAALDAGNKMMHTAKIGARRFIDYIMPVTLELADAGLVSIKYKTIEDIVKENNEVTSDGELKENEEKSVKSYITEIVDMTSKESIDELKNVYNMPYHHEAALNVKNKMSVSEIKHKFMDEELEAEDDAYRPEFLKPEKPSKYVPEFMGGKKEENIGAAKGTAFHRIMELINFADDSLINADIETVKKMMEGMVDSGLIAKEDAELVSPAKVSSFLQNDFIHTLNRASKEGRLHKEQPFVMGISPKEAGVETVADEEILVQGIIDLFIEEDDGLILLDYKTDSVENADRLIRRYAKQMELYGIALSKAYGKPVKKYLFYAFTLTKLIDFIP